MKLRTSLTAIALALMCGTASAQPRHCRHHRHTAKTVVVKTAANPCISNSFCQKDRLGMAVAYIRNNGTITAKKYAGITGLTRAAAEAELEAFALDRSKPIIKVPDSKKRIYRLRG